MDRHGSDKTFAESHFSRINFLGAVTTYKPKTKNHTFCNSDMD